MHLFGYVQPLSHCFIQLQLVVITSGLKH